MTVPSSQRRGPRDTPLSSYAQGQMFPLIYPADVMTGSTRDRRLRLATIVLACCCAVRTAAGQGQTLAQMDHMMWTARDGAPQSIAALAQAADGTLWVGSERGLVNFDGRTFRPFQPPAGEPELPAMPVKSILVAR